MKPDQINPQPSPCQLLPGVIALVHLAGAALVAEFARPDGPRGSGDKAAIDAALEAALRDGLHGLLPVPVIAEELPNKHPGSAAKIWLVDPHDGTSAFLEGYRGSAVSIALLDGGQPVLGVVYAPSSPDRGPDLIAWAEGMDHLLRNGEAVRHDLREAHLTSGAVVFLNHRAAQQPISNGKWLAPARFVAMPSIAYRMARVACGDGVATLSFSGPEALDYAAGHALLRGAHGVFLDESGRPVSYSADGSSHVVSCFGGGERAVRELLKKSQARSSGRGEMRAAPRVSMAWPRAVESSKLDRAVGCLQGQLIGDSLGSLVEFQDAKRIARAFPDGVRDLADGGVWNTLAGQATDDSELALALARCLVAQTTFDADAVAATYGDWYRSAPFDIGSTTSQAFSILQPKSTNSAAVAMAAANSASAANGSLMRVAPIGIAARDPLQAAAWATVDSRLSHPHPQCVASCAAFAAAIHAGISGGDATNMLETALQAARDLAAHEVIEALESAAAGHLPADFQSQMGWVLIALQNAFHQLLHCSNAVEALVETVGKGGDTDTNGAIAGALLGALHGRQGWPARWTTPLLACRPALALVARQPRPDKYWPDDVPELAEALLGLWT